MTVRELTGLFHTGMVVTDLDTAMTRLGRALGLRWAPPGVSDGPLHIPGGTAHRRLRYTYSHGGPHHIELLELQDDSAFAAATGGPNLHHLGFAVDDLRAASQRLIDNGYPREVAGIADDGDIASFAYHYNTDGGLWLELVAHDLVDRLGITDTSPRQPKLVQQR